jgi:hypothetical protein
MLYPEEIPAPSDKAPSRSWYAVVGAAIVLLILL